MIVLITLFRNINKHCNINCSSIEYDKYKMFELNRTIFYTCSNEMNNLLLNEFINIYEVEFAVIQTKLNKAAGIDGLPNEESKNHFN